MKQLKVKHILIILLAMTFLILPACSKKKTPTTTTTKTLANVPVTPTTTAIQINTPAAIPRPTQAAENQKGVVTADGVNIRTAPGTSGSSVIKTVPDGTELEVIKANYSPGWHQVKFEGQTAYVSADYVQLKGPAPTSAPAAPIATTANNAYPVTTTTAKAP